MGHGLIWGAVGLSNGWNSEYFQEHRMLKGIWQNAISLFCKARLEGGSRTLMLRLSTHRGRTEVLSNREKISERVQVLFLFCDSGCDPLHYHFGPPAENNYNR